jgi:PIN domain nuclease of toxin-antitoxin system
VRLLLDTHALLWWLTGDEALPPSAREAIGDASNEVIVSAASAWEIATKHRLGKLPSAAVIAADVGAHIVDQGFHALPILVSHGQVAGALPGPHRDPFDRMMIAQATVEKLVVVSKDAIFDAYGVMRLWA